MRVRSLVITLLAVLGLFVVLQMLFIIATWQADWFRQPLAVAYTVVWVLAGLAGLSAAFRPPRGVPAATWERLPWLGAGALLGFVVPTMFSAGPYMLLAATLFAAAAALRAPRGRYALEALALAIVVTAIVLGIASLA